MANAFTPVFSGSFSGELVYDMTNYVVADTFKTNVESVNIVYRPIYAYKMTGFKPFKYSTMGNISGTAILADIEIMLVGSLNKAIHRQLITLAHGIKSAGLYLTWRDDFVSSCNYTCRWINASDFVENGELLCGGSMRLEAWTIAAI